ncbi:DUF2290 domain-containing protein [Afipia clevelandensis]|uniref:DUF2290 domain-containing protein n=1 Tax=Afipia clevelandensis ATCC 49720 TaxID=883079 RepID=K8NU27_9BRAD|nr:DUF2290 domain-containing protein [Afipia clevelandensis]EKS32656.1 hypothetical protein HMPREF9696_03633 [Afipia clevelandensis ATCC 49720]
MNSADFARKIRASWDLLYGEAGLARTVSNLTSLPVDQEFNRTALSRTATYRDIYLAALSRSYYNIILNDYSMFQYSWMGEQSWRLAYLPNPWIAGVHEAEDAVEQWEALEEIGGMEPEHVDHLIADMPYASAIPSIRFEYATHQYRELSHPAAHMHIGRHAENRWPYARLLNPLTFTMMIVKMYYVDRWAALSSYYGHAPALCLDMTFIDELSRSTVVHDFSENEKRSLHFAAF